MGVELGMDVGGLVPEALIHLLKKMPFYRVNEEGPDKCQDHDDDDHCHRRDSEPYRS